MDVDKNINVDSPFAKILRGEEPGVVIARDDEQRFAIISSLEPEAAIHWLAVPFESGYSTEEMKHNEGDRFLRLLDYALAETKERIGDYPGLANGFTVKFHCGAYETIPHAKFHILSIE
jgi:diadenosine tetraphosphate (Ap4A) HIT family hydrolase